MNDSSPGAAAPRWSVSLPLLIAAIGLLAAIVFLLLVEPRVAHRTAATAVEQAAVDLDGDLAAVNRRLESVEGVVERLAVDVSALIQATTDSVLSAAFEDRTRLRRNGMVGPVAGQFDFRRDAGVWVRRSTADDPDLRALYGGAMMALEGVRAIADSSLPRIWVIGLDGGEAAITPYDSTYFFQNDGDNDYRGTDWLERTRPAPGGPPRASWLASFYTDGINRWLVSVGAPLLIRGAWWGSVGVDADIGKLLGGDGHFERSPGEVRIYSASGVPVFAPGPEQTLTLGLDRTLLDRLHADSVLAPFDVGDRIVLVRPIPAADWLVVASYSRTALEAPIRRLFSFGRWGLAALGVVALAMGAWLGRRDQVRKWQAEVQLRSTAERFERLFQLLPDGLTLTTTDTTTIYEVNAGFCRIAGYEREELVGRRALDLDLWAEPEELDQAMADIRLNGSVTALSGRLRRKDRAVRECLFSAQVVEIDGVRYLLSIVRDVTDERRLEHQFVHAQKMEAVGRLAGGIAHDFNNIITAISGHASLALSQVRRGDPVAADLSEIIRSGKRAADLTRQLLGFARRQVAQPKVLDLALQVRESERFLGRLLGEDVALSVTTHGQSAFARMDPGQFEQILANLAVNARDAMPRGGRLTVDVDRVGATVIVSVTDSGLGMSDEVRAHIFEPFFTTKEPGTGTGLGLSTCYGIMRQAGGDIEVDSTPGQGTTIRLVFPAVESTVTESAPGRPPGAGRVGAGTVLVVEDERGVREVFRRALAEAGYRVYSAETGSEAVERFVSRVA
ncbi:MAG: ATP-binding protein, partial [Gemmatimonadales bacterium]